MIADALQQLQRIFPIEDLAEAWARLSPADRGAILGVAALFILRRFIGGQRDLAALGFGFIGLGFFAYATILFVGLTG
jgi:hypothetical protein